MRLLQFISLDPQTPTCQIDGIGWTYRDQTGIEYFGLQGCHKSLSALHAEMEGLIKAMSYLHDLHIATIHIETNCTDLVEMIGNPIDCLSFPSELVSCRLIRDGFAGFSIYYIPRSRNMRTIFIPRRKEAVVFSFPMYIRPDKSVHLFRLMTSNT